MEIMFGVVAVSVVIVLGIFVFVLGYKKAPPDVAYIVTGRKSRVLIGESGFVCPFLERLDKIDLSMISIDVKTPDYVPNSEYIDVKVDAAVKVRVSDDPELRALAIKNFLNQGQDYIISQVVDVLQGNVREIIGTMCLSDMITDRKAFGERVKDNAVPDLKKMGLEIISFNIQGFEDRSGVIKNMGIDNVERIKKDAAIAASKAQKEIAIATSTDKKEANDIEVENKLIMARKVTEYDIEAANLKKQVEIQRAQADLAHQIETERQRKTLEIQTADANITKQEKEALRMAQVVEVNKQEFTATVNNQAEADRFKRQQEAEADLFEKTKVYEAIKLEAAARLDVKQKEAAGIKAIGEAEAEAATSMGIATATSIEKKAVAMAKYDKSGQLEMLYNVLPKIASAIAEPLNNTEKIIMYGEDGIGKFIQQMTKTISQTIEGVSEGSGIDINGALSKFNKNLTEDKEDGISIVDTD